MRRVTSPLAGLAAAALAAAVLVPSGPAAAAPDEVDTSALREAVTSGGILGHARALQRIANTHGGTRASGTPGYRASGIYVRDTLRAAGYRVYLQNFTFPYFRDNGTTVSQVAPTPTTYDAATLRFSSPGDVTGTLVPTRTIAIPPGSPGSTTSGCSASDFTPASSAPQVALIQRGFCDLGTKVSNAAAAGYDAALVFNEGQEGRTDVFEGALGGPSAIPAATLGYADGVALHQATQSGPVTVRVDADTEADPARRSFNVIAKSRQGAQSGEPIVVGAHLDSPAAGPGINGNASGVATMLEIARQLRTTRMQSRLQRRIRFAFWGAGEADLRGSRHYVETLTEAGRSRIAAYLDLDGLGSPNFVRFVQDGDGSGGGPAGPEGSGAIEQILADHFTDQGLPFSPADLDGRSDYLPFFDAGIPVGAVLGGTDGVKTATEAETYGGVAGEAYDPCHRQACDDINNLSTQALAELGDAAADAVATLALSEADLVEPGDVAP